MQQQQLGNHQSSYLPHQHQRAASPWARTMASIHAQQNENQVTTTTGNNMVQQQQQQSDEGGEPEEQYSQVAAMTTQMPLPQETAIPPPRRKRNNSLIPPELMNDNTEGGRERAALATVFGVREYTESKVFWERQIAYYHDNGPVASADEAATAASSGSGAEGYVSITGRSVLSSPLLRRSPSPRPTTSDKLVDHSIASLLDSALDNAGSSDKQAKSTAATSSLQVPLSSSTANNNNNDAVLPTTNLFLLPDIPVVSKFTDFFEETDNLRSPSKVRSFSVASTLPAGEQQQHHYHEYASSVTSDRWANEIAPPLVFIGYPPAIFDLLKSDQDERIIMWGPDPQFLSASMATTTVAGKQPSQHHQQSSFSSTFFVSGSTIATSTQQREVTPGSNKPNIRGFSSNTTAAANTSSADAVKNSSRKSRWVIPDGLKIKKSTLKIRNKLYDNEHEARSSSLFRFSKRHGKNKTMLMLDDQSSISSVNSTQIPQVIEAATVEKLVEKLTISLDYTFMTDFFLTYRTFISPTQLCQLLILRFRWGLESDEEERRIVRIRTFVVLRHWLLNYFVHDFLPCRDLRIILTSFLNSLPFHPLVKRSPRDQRIVKSLKRVVRRLKKVYYKNSSTSERVKVIAPPPPTEEQERVEEMVRQKLAQGPIRRKTDIVSSVNVSDRHHGNMAVQDARLAPVVVVGSVRNVKSSPVDVHPTTTQAARRNRSNASISRTRRRNQIDEKMAVKSSYLQRMEQQKRVMAAAAAAAEPDAAEDNVSSKCSVLSDDSLESALSPGTTDVESSAGDSDSEQDEEEEEDDDDDEEDDESKSQQPSTKEREELERVRQRREEEEERKRAEFFSPKHPNEEQPIHPTASVPSSDKTSDNGCLVSRIAQQLQAQDLSSNRDNTTTSAQTTTSAPNVGHQQRRQRGSGPLYLGQLGSSTTSGSNMQIQEAETASVDNETATTQHMRSSIVSTNSVSPRAPPPHMAELDLPRPQRTATATAPDPRASVTSLYPRPFILYFRSEHMARQFCLIEANVLLNIDWEEMVHCRWTKMSTEQPLSESAYEDDFSSIVDDDHVNYTRRTRQLQLARRNKGGGIESVIKRFNAVCQWVTSEIVRTRSLDERVRVVEKFIRLAQKCKLYCNFATLVQILLGLQSPAVSRLKRTWDRVGSSEMRMLEQLSTFTSPMKNWKHIRDSMTQVAEEYGMSPIEVQIEMPGTNQHAFKKTKIKIPFGGCIPFLGIYLSDLVFNSEQPPYVHPNLENSKIYHAHTHTMSSDISPLLTQPLVNFRKHRITATVIKRVLTFQNLARRYSFEHDAELYFLCSELEPLDQGTIRRLSNEIEPDT